MIQSVHIENFKSVVDLTLDLGTFNVLIGENGCGKSNILEAIAFGAAACADKLDREFMGSRGIRLTNPEFMFSAFKDITPSSSIIVSFKINEREYIFDLINESNTSKKWTKKVVISLAEQSLPHLFITLNKTEINFKK